MQRLRIFSLLFVPCLLLLCLSDTAFGQPTLTITDVNGTTVGNMGTLVFNIPSGTTSSQTLTVNATQGGNPVVTTIAYAVQNDPQTGQPYTWVRFPGNTTSGSQNTSSATITVTANATALSTSTLHAIFSVGVNSATSQGATLINVTLNVNGTSVLSASPTSVAFTAAQAATNATPLSQLVQISSSTTALSYNLTVQYANGSGWLQYNPTTGTTGNTNTNRFSVSANPAGLAAGNYSATITATSTTTADAVNIPITLAVGTTGILTISPSNPTPFLYQVGGTVTPLTQVITVSATTTTFFNISSNVGWLNSNSFGGSAGPGSPYQFSINASPSGLAVNSYSGTLTFTPTNGSGASPQSIPVKLVVSNNPLLQVSATQLSFTAGFSGQSPADQSVNVTATGTGSAVGFNIVSDSTWLSASASQNFTPSTLTVHITQGNLAVGNYTGNLTLTPTNGDQYSVTIQVTLAVGTSQQLTVGPPVLLFSFQSNRIVPPAQVVSVGSTGQQVTFNVSAQPSTCTGSNWLSASASQFTSPASITVSVSPTSLPVGTCTGVVTVTPSSGNAVQVPVTVIIAATPLLMITMPGGFGYETVQQGSGTGAINRQISVGSTDNSALAFTVTPNTSSGGNWLAIGGGGQTPQNVSVVIQPAGLTPGVYGGNIVINSATLPSGSFTIPIQLTVTPNITINISPGQLSFTASQNGPTPANQTIQFTNSGGGTPTFTASVSSNCASLISVSPTSGVATGQLTVSVISTNATIGANNCQINLTYFNSASQSAVIPVTYTITTAQTLSVTPSSLTFAYQLTQPPPATQKISLSSTGGAVQFTVGVSSTPTGWLAVDTPSGATPADGTARIVNVSVSTTGLGIGQYTGQVTVSAPGVLANPVAIQVTINVTAAPLPVLTTVTSTATNVSGTIAAGELITIKGMLLGPTTAGGVLFSLNASGGVNSTLSGVRVLFDNIPGTPIFVSAGQINVIVPYEIAGRVSSNIVVEYQGIQSAPFGLRIADSAPGMFTLNQAGSGQIAAVNQNGTFNGPVGGGTIPASLGATGTTVVLYGTGGGQTSPPGQTGTVTPASPLMKIPGVISATVGGAAARVDFAGQAPGLVTGVMQFNLFLFPGTPTGNQPVVITINGISSPLGATIAVAP